MRILLVFPSEVDPARFLERCQALVGEGHELAICCVESADSSLHSTLTAQREVTALLRGALKARAEAIPIFVVTGRTGDSVEDYARSWGATEVRT